jgi:farnesyl-diphosphate farnesyltransferase
MPTLNEMLRATSRTFSIGIERLPGVLGSAVMVSYLLLRVSDYIEDDEGRPDAEKVALLELWDSILAGYTDVTQLTTQLSEPDGSNPDGVVAWHAAQVLEALYSLPPTIQTIIIANVRDTTQGMARWVARGPQVADENDMDNYMHEVAGRVGYLLTDLFSCHSWYIRWQKSALMPLAREFGLALQTVNVIRGLREDYERGWIFVPDSFCTALEITREDLFRPEYTSQSLQVLKKLTDKADHHLESALEYLKALPPWQYSIRLFCVYPLMFAVRTLAISRQNRAVLDGEVKITREEVAQIVKDTTLWSWSNPWLDNYYQKLRVISNPLV